jgi:hypothetical protein
MKSCSMTMLGRSDVCGYDGSELLILVVIDLKIYALNNGFA